MSRFKLHSFVVSASLFLLPNVSYSQTHKGISFQGVIKLPSGEYPTKSGLTVNSYILSSNNCILREEQFTGVNVSNGYINIPIGTGLVTGDDPGLTMKQVMDNSGPITQGPNKTSGLVCLDKDGNVNPSVTSFNPTTGDGRRKFRLNVVIDGTPVIADFNMRSMAYAINAESSDDAKKLNGKTDTSFIQTSTNITQTAVESWFSSLALLPIINGTYNAPTATTATNLVGGIDGLLPAQSGNTGKFLKTNGTSVSWADIPAAAAGLTQVGLDLPTSVFTNGADITANGKVSATFSTQNAKTFFAGPTAGTAVPSFRTLTTGDVSGFDTDVANIADTQISGKRNAANGIAGLDANSKIPTSLLPNDAFFSDSVKTGVFKIAGPASSEIQLSAPTTSVTSYNLVLPDAGSTAGKVLKIGSVTGSTMNLIWDKDAEGVGTLTSVGLVLPTDIFQVPSSPLTANGDLTASLKSQTQKYVLAAPNAADGAPVFRQLLVSDISNAGTAALYNVSPLVDASGSQVVLGNDSRLGNPREPIDGSVTTAKIADEAVTDAKIAGIAANKISGQIPSGSLPVASDTTVGIVNIIAQTFKGAKTFIDNVVMQGTLAVSGSISAASLSTSGNVSATGAVSADRIKVANSAATCDASSEGSIRYNSTSKKFEGCNGTTWANISQGTIANLSIGAPSASLVKSGPVSFDITYGSGTDTATINLTTGNITINGANTGCTVTGVTGTGSTRTVVVNNCSGTGSVSISVAAGSATSTTGDVAPAAGPSSTYAVDNTGPNAPTGVTLGSVPSNLTNSPTITYSAATDVGGSTIANHQVQIIKTSDSSVIKAWANHSSGSDVAALSLTTNTEYSVLVRAVDSLGNLGTPSIAVNWTSINDPCLGSPTPGTTCAGGAIYLGSLSWGSSSVSSGAADKYMTTPGGCGEIPAGQKVTGINTPGGDYPSADFTPTCSGTDALTKYWNDGSSNWYDFPNLTNYQEAAGTGYGATYKDNKYGSQNAVEIVAITAPGSGGYHAAARYCDKLVYGGYNDWYLPNRYELNLFYTNKASIPGLDLTGSWYWSSTEYTNTGSWVQRFNDGYQNFYAKNTNYRVRCVRRF